jgi:hypothetical protein
MAKNKGCGGILAVYTFGTKNDGYRQKTETDDPISGGEKEIGE